ncbi:hypothetical protein H4219_005908, partial [Mycoemilia scoparia]
MLSGDGQYCPPAFSYFSIFSPDLRRKKLNLRTGKFQESPILYYVAAETPQYYPEPKKKPTIIHRRPVPPPPPPPLQQQSSSESQIATDSNDDDDEANTQKSLKNVPKTLEDDNSSKTTTINSNNTPKNTDRDGTNINEVTMSTISNSAQNRSQITSSDPIPGLTRERFVDLDTQLREIGAVQALTKFSQKFTFQSSTTDSKTTQQQHTQVIRSEKRCIAIFQAEPEIWFTLCVIFPRRIRSIPGEKDAVSIEFIESDLTDDAIINWLKREYHAYRLMYGPIQPHLNYLCDVVSDSEGCAATAGGGDQERLIVQLETNLADYFGKVVWGFDSRWSQNRTSELDLIHTVGGVPKKIIGSATNRYFEQCWDVLSLLPSHSDDNELRTRANTLSDKDKDKGPTINTAATARSTSKRKGKEKDVGSDDNTEAMPGASKDEVLSFNKFEQNAEYRVEGMFVYWQGQDLLWSSCPEDSLHPSESLKALDAKALTAQALTSWVRSTYSKGFQDPPYRPQPKQRNDAHATSKALKDSLKEISDYKDSSPRSNRNKKKNKNDDAKSIFSSIVGISTKLAAPLIPGMGGGEGSGNRDTSDSASKSTWGYLTGALSWNRASPSLKPQQSPHDNIHTSAEVLNKADDEVAESDARSIGNTETYSSESVKPDIDDRSSIKSKTETTTAIGAPFRISTNFTSTFSDAVSALVEPKPPPSIKQDPPFKGTQVSARPITMVFNDTSSNFKDRAPSVPMSSGARSTRRYGSPSVFRKTPHHSSSSSQYPIPRVKSKASLSESLASSMRFPVEGHFYSDSKSIAPSLYSVSGRSLGIHSSTVGNDDIFNQDYHSQNQNHLDPMVLPGVHPDYTFVNTLTSAAKIETADILAPEAKDTESDDQDIGSNIESLVSEAVGNTLFPNTGDLVDETRGVVLAPRGIQGMQYDKRYLRSLYGSFVNSGEPPKFSLPKIAIPNPQSLPPPQPSADDVFGDLDTASNHLLITCETPLWVDSLVGHMIHNHHEEKCHTFAYKYGELLFLVLIRKRRDMVHNNISDEAYQAIERIIHSFSPTLLFHTTKNNQLTEKLYNSLPFKDKVYYFHRNMTTNALHSSFSPTTGVVSGYTGNHSVLYGFQGSNLTPNAKSKKNASLELAPSSSGNDKKHHDHKSSLYITAQRLSQNDILLNDSFDILNPLQSPSLKPPVAPPHIVFKPHPLIGNVIDDPSPSQSPHGQKKTDGERDRNNASASPYNNSMAQRQRAKSFNNKGQHQELVGSVIGGNRFVVEQKMLLNMYSQFTRHSYIRDIAIRLSNQNWVAARYTKGHQYHKHHHPYTSAPLTNTFNINYKSQYTSILPYKQSPTLSTTTASPTFGSTFSPLGSPRSGGLGKGDPSFWCYVIPQQKGTLADTR